MRRVLPALLAALALLSAGAVACGGDSGPDAATVAASTTPSSNLTIKASSLKFDKKALVALPNTEVVLSFENADSSVLHDVAIYKDSSAQEKLFATDLFNGKETKEYRFQTPPPGTYYFRCDAHPDMNGIFEVRAN